MSFKNPDRLKKKKNIVKKYPKKSDGSTKTGTRKKPNA